MSIKDQLKCCIEEVFANVNIETSTMASLEHVVKPCQQHLKNTSNFFGQIISLYLYDSQEGTKYCRRFYCGRPTTDWNKVYIFILFLTLLTAVTGNLFVIIVSIKARRIRSCVANYFVMSLAFSDLFASAFSIPIKMEFSMYNRHFCNKPNVCRMYMTTDNTFFVASIVQLFVIAIDRYVAVIYPYRYNKILTCKRTKQIIFLVWLHAIIWSVLYNFRFKTRTFDAVEVTHFVCLRRGKIYYQILLPLIFFTPCIIMCFLYFKIWQVAVHQAKDIDKRRQYSSQLEVYNAGVSSIQKSFFANHKLELKATKVILTVFGTFVICWLPLSIMTFLYTIYDLKVSTLVYVILCDYLPNLSSMLNPFIYCILHKDFKHSFEHILKKMRAEFDHRLSLRERPQSSTTTNWISDKLHDNTIENFETQL